MLTRSLTTATTTDGGGPPGADRGPVGLLFPTLYLPPENEAIWLAAIKPAESLPMGRRGEPPRR